MTGRLVQSEPASGLGVQHFGTLLAGMGGADAVIFTGGIGENSPEIRAGICEGLEWAGP
jgi:acetate kinase